MQNSMPILACTDLNTDIGKVITEGDFGWWCESNSVDGFIEKIDEICNIDLEKYGLNGYQYIQKHYTVEESYEIICESLM